MSSSFAIVSTRSLFALGLAALAGCGADSWEASTNNRLRPLGTFDGGGGPPPAGGFVADPHQGGLATSVRVLGVFAARLVDVYDLDAATAVRTLQHRDFPIGLDIAGNGTDYELRWSQAGQRDVLTILHPAGSAAYAHAFAQIDANMVPLVDKGIAPGTLPPYSAAARNGALVVRFDDLLDGATLDQNTLKTFVTDGLGPVPLLPFEARVIADQNHGGLADFDGNGVPEFYSTRVIVDLTISVLDSQSSPVPLPVNGLGLPPATSALIPSALLRIPTLVNAPTGQFAVLRNPSGHAVSFANSGSNDPGSVTKDVVRAFRSGSSTLGDPYNGGLPDGQAPALVGVQPITLVRAVASSPGQYHVAIEFANDVCLRLPRPGDGIELANHVFEVVAGAVPPVALNGGHFVNHLRVQLLTGDPNTLTLGMPGVLTAVFSAAAGDSADCFVRFSPAAAKPPVRDVSPAATVLMRFTEPMDPLSVQSLDTFTVRNPSIVFNLLQKVAGNIVASVDQREFRFVPVVPLSHSSGATETYEIALDGGVEHLVDLSGNGLAEPWPATRFGLDPAAPTQVTGAVSLAFGSVDEDGNGAPEVRGQFLYDLAHGTLRSRPVTRFSSVADPSQAVVGSMVPFTQGLQTPLSPFGSKAMLTWRYHDVGFGLTDETTMNLDVEGMAWAPFAATVVADHFSEFRMALAHSKFLPDEFINPISLLPAWPQSGLVKTFDNNQLDPVNDPLKVVHPKASGYTVNPVDQFTSSTGTVMMPWPLNRNIPPSQFQRYTWRDTALTTVGGPNGNGVDTDRLIQVTGTGQKLYIANNVPTIGLPLLMEFRCYPDTGAFGLNNFKVDIALNSSARPAFRAYSTGGVLKGGTPLIVDPDNEPTAKGGIGPNGVPTGPGSEIDPVFHEGQADFVVRVSRLHTIWFDTLAFTAQFSAPVIEPSPSNQPAGTQIVLAFRGATNVTNGTGTPVPSRDATKYDFYGDPFKSGGQPLFVVTYPGGDATWKPSTSALNSLRFVQVRASMIANPDTQLVPTLSGFSLPFAQ